MDIVETARELRHKGSYGYILQTYVNRDGWYGKLSKELSGFYIENMTDFNYSTCFSFILNISPVFARLTSKEYYDYLKQHGEILSISIEISAIGPYGCIRFLKRLLEPEPNTTLIASHTPYAAEHNTLANQIRHFLIGEGFIILDEPLLTQFVPGVTLELRTSNVQVYHCLFQDQY